MNFLHKSLYLSVCLCAHFIAVASDKNTLTCAATANPASLGSQRATPIRRLPGSQQELKLLLTAIDALVTSDSVTHTFAEDTKTYSATLTSGDTIKSSHGPEKHSYTAQQLVVTGENAQSIVYNKLDSLPIYKKLDSIWCKARSDREIRTLLQLELEAAAIKKYETAEHRDRLVYSLASLNMQGAVIN